MFSFQIEPRITRITVIMRTKLWSFLICAIRAIGGLFCIEFNWPGRELNPRPAAYKAAALAI
jgi:hypothetical protein